MGKKGYNNHILVGRSHCHRLSFPTVPGAKDALTCLQNTSISQYPPHKLLSANEIRPLKYVYEKVLLHLKEGLLNVKCV